MDVLSMISSADDTVKVKCNVPEWGITLYICSMSAAQRCELEKLCTKGGGADDPALLRAHTLAFSLQTIDGNQLCTPETAGALMAKRADIIERLFEKAIEVNAITAAAVEQIEKN